MHYLSKSDYKVARTCAAKLYFKKCGYPSERDENEYLQFLADGGYMVESIAKLLHPEGVEIGFDGGPQASSALTMDALRADRVTLFEATLVSGNKLARTDILKKRGSRFDLIEVKAKSIDNADPSLFRGKKGIRAEWQEYLEDVTFQTHVLEALFPDAVVVPHLCLVDKSKTTTIESIYSCFELTHPDLTGRFRRPSVRFTGDVENLRRQHFLTTLNVRAEVDDLMPTIIAESDRFAASLSGEISRIPVEISVKCRGCEYRPEPDGSDPRNGFGECWQALADASPHILDMYQVSGIGGRGGPIVSALLSRGRANLADLTEGDLAKADGSVGPVAQRQRIQLEYAKRNEEFISSNLPGLLRSHVYPLHFIDFETSRVAVPYHAGMRPYEQVAFQWSCHTLREAGGAIEHSEWINAEEAYPNFDFARSLSHHLGDHGTVYTWSHHERTVLKDIVEQMLHYGRRDESLMACLIAITEGASQLNIVDLCALAKEHYFHPLMKGRLSIKFVLPAVWRTNEALHRDPLFARYYRMGADGHPDDPYKTLPPLPFPDEEDGTEEAVVVDGTGAMRAYQEMLYGLSRTDATRKEHWRRLLLQYCELDTAAMVMIWKHWSGDRS